MTLLSQKYRFLMVTIFNPGKQVSPSAVGYQWFTSHLSDHKSGYFFSIKTWQNTTPEGNQTETVIITPTPKPTNSSGVRLEGYKKLIHDFLTLEASTITHIAGKDSVIIDDKPAIWLMKALTNSRLEVLYTLEAFHNKIIVLPELFGFDTSLTFIVTMTAITLDHLGYLVRALYLSQQAGQPIELTAVLVHTNNDYCLTLYQEDIDLIGYPDLPKPLAWITSAPDTSFPSGMAHSYAHPASITHKRQPSAITEPAPDPDPPEYPHNFQGQQTALPDHH